MAHCVFIAPGDTAIGEALNKEARLHGYNVISTVSPALEAESEEEERGIEWNRRSLLSARNAVLEAVNTFETIDIGILIHQPETGEGATHELSPVEIERRLDQEQKATFFMLRELLSLFVRQRSGMLTMVHYSPGDVPGLPLSSAASAAFRGAAEALFTLYQNEELIINGFDSSKDQSDGYARYIFQTLQNKAVHGKWHRFGSSGRQAKSRLMRG